MSLKVGFESAACQAIADQSGELGYEMTGAEADQQEPASSEPATAEEPPARDAPPSHPLPGVVSQPIHLAPRPQFLAGREKLLANLHARLTAGDAPWPRITVLYGLGGTGKTSLAVEYAQSGWNRAVRRHSGCP